MNENHSPEFFGYDVLESEFGICRGTGYAYVSRRLIPHYRLGGRHIKFKRSEITKWLEKLRVSPRANGGAA